MSAAKKLKTVAFPVPQNHDEANKLIFELGEMQRVRDLTTTAMNQKLAEVKAEFEDVAAASKKGIEDRVAALQAYCAAHRAELLKGDAKTYRFAAGEVQWRNRPASVKVLDGAKAILWYVENKLKCFIREKQELNKEEILKYPQNGAKNPHIRIGSGGEDFYVKPFETQLEEVA